jgi:hypothetical protein
MAIYLGLVAGIGALLFVPLSGAFMANWGFNGLILAVLAVGIVINIQQVVALKPEIDWIKLFRTGETGISVTREPRLLKPLARHLQGLRKDHFRLSALSLRTLLDGIRARLDESREISRYLIGLLIFLGLLGTFWGLLGTIGAVGRVISGLDVSGGDVNQVFGTLKAGLEEPLDGMGTAFSSSLFGLGGSLVLGFLDLQAGHAQNRFFNGLEEWLSGVTQFIDEPGRPAVSNAPPVEIEVAGTMAPLLEEMRAQRRLLEDLLGRSDGPSRARED